MLRSSAAIRAVEQTQRTLGQFVSKRVKATESRSYLQNRQKLSVKASQAGYSGDGSLRHGDEGGVGGPRAGASNPGDELAGKNGLFKGARELGSSRLLEKPAEFLGLLLNGYNKALKSHPVATKALTSLVGFALGDRIAQTMSGGAVFDYFRFFRMSLYGLLVDGPVGHYFYQFLDTKVYPEDPKGTRAVLTKTAVDQLIWAPVMTVVFLVFLTTLEGHPESAFDVVQAKLVPIMIANFGVWPLAHLINFRFVPPEQRILFNNVVAIAWTTYLSWSCGAGTGGIGGHSGTPRDALAAGIPCAAAGASALLHTPHVADIVRQTTALESMLVSWGVDGLPNAEQGGTDLLINYFRLKAEVLDTVCRSG